jgi:hypothetical protein
LRFRNGGNPSQRKPKFSLLAVAFQPISHCMIAELQKAVNNQFSVVRVFWVA